MYDYYDYGGTGGSPILTIIYILVLVMNLAAMWKIFVKAGEPGWAAIVPFYNLYVFFQITWGSGSKFLLLLIPIYNIVVVIQTVVKLARVFGKSDGFVVGLLFLGPVFYMILAFGNALYIGIPGLGGNGYYGNDYQSQAGYMPQQNYQDQGVDPNAYMNGQTTHAAFCPNCGSPISPGSVLCPKCGNRIG